MIYRKIIGDATVEYEGTPEEIRGVLDREGKIVNKEATSPTINISIKDISTNELVEQLSRRTGVKLHRVGTGEQCTLSIHGVSPNSSGSRIIGPGILLECNEIYYVE